MSTKSLLTSGCSFSEHFNHWSTKRTWPAFLQDYFPNGTEFVHTGMGSTGNDLIARKGIFMCSNALKEYKHDQIVLLLMWSGLARKAILSDNRTNIIRAEHFRKSHNSLVPSQGSNYANELLDTNTPSWVWFNPSWLNDPGVADWYIKYDNDHQQFDATLWNMLQVQNFCKLHNIQYHWMTMNNELDNFISMYGNNFYSLYLIEQLDMSNRISMHGEYEWILSNHPDKFLEDKMHPSPEGHKLFTNDVIVPYLVNKGILNV